MKYDVVILGAGAAGLMCALQAGRRGRKVLLLDHMNKVGGKILISGGGRCNFTNIDTSPAQFVSENEHFCKSALSRYKPNDFLEMIKAHDIAYHEKKLGQLFCDHSASDIVRMLEAECKSARVEIKLGAEIKAVQSVQSSDASDCRFEVETPSQKFLTKSLVVATGGLSIPKIGATGLGYQIARQFGLDVVATRPALDGFTLTNPAYAMIKELSGVSIDCILTCNGYSFRENILFTHKGMSGPAALQGSLHWKEKSHVEINLCPDKNIRELLLKRKKDKSPHTLVKFLGEFLPQRFAEAFAQHFLPHSEDTLKALCQVSDKVLIEWSQQITAWTLLPSGTVGYSKAEVTRGGVSTDELSSKSMESRKVPGLFFIGEVVDVTGWLGGYNFQWAWASAWAAAQEL